MEDEGEILGPVAREDEREIKDPVARPFEQFSKACIVCYSSLGEGEINVFILNLSGGGGGGGSSGGNMTRCPTLRLDGKAFSSWTFSVIGTTFYAFEGLDVMGNGGGKGIYKFKLPSSDEANLALNKTMLSQISLMNEAKVFPAAVPCPDGKKIILFSTSIDETTTFELFDPIRLFCSKLPKLRAAWVPKNSCPLVRSHTFMSTSEFLLATEFGLFTIDIGATKPIWKKLKNFYGGMTPPSYFKVMGNSLCLTPMCAYNIIGLDCRSAREDNGEKKAYDSIHRVNYYYPNSSLISDDDYEYVTSSIILLDGGENNVCKFCILKAGENTNSEDGENTNSEDGENSEGLMSVDVYECDIDRCMNELVKNSENEEVEQLRKMEQIQKWHDELPRQYDIRDMRWSEYSRKVNDLLGRRESHPLPYTRLKMSLRFAFAANEFVICDFSFIPMGVSPISPPPALEFEGEPTYAPGVYLAEASEEECYVSTA